MRWPSKVKLVIVGGGKTTTLEPYTSHELGAPPGQVPRAPPLTPRPAPPVDPELLTGPLTPLFTRDFTAGLVVGAIASAFVCLVVFVSGVAWFTR